MTKIKKENFAVKKEAANLLLSLDKPIKAPKGISSSDAMLALFINDYEVEIGKAKM